MAGPKPILSPSILAADFASLGRDVIAAADSGVTHLHVDVMDGHFVPNISIGIPIVKSLRPIADHHNLFLDVHLMISNPDQYIQAFADAGADSLTVHVEATDHLHRTLQAIKQAGVQAGVALNPATPLSSLDEILDLPDLILLMTVNPGFGGQAFIPSSLGKIDRLRQKLQSARLATPIQVDGGVKISNAAEVFQAGATNLVAGSAIFGGDQSISENVRAFFKTLNAAGHLSV